MNDKPKISDILSNTNLEELKKFISSIQEPKQDEKSVFKPERLKNLRNNTSYPKKYSSGLKG